MNESVKKPIIYELFIIAIYSLQNVNKQFSEMKNKHQNSLFSTSIVFPGLEPILYAGQNYDLRPTFSENYFWQQTALQKKLKSYWKKQLEKKWKTTGKNQFFWKTSFFKSLLAFITFMNYEHAYLVETFLHILFSHFAFGKKEKRNKKKVCRNSSCLQSVT